MSTSNLFLGLTIAALALGCKRDDDTDDSGQIIDDTGESETETETDDSESGPDDSESGDSDSDSDSEDVSDTPVPSDAPQGFAFCAAGGRVVGPTHNGILCLGPLDVAGGYVDGSTHTWQAGPIYVLAP